VKSIYCLSNYVSNNGSADSLIFHDTIVIHSSHGFDDFYKSYSAIGLKNYKPLFSDLIPISVTIANESLISTINGSVSGYPFCKYGTLLVRYGWHTPILFLCISKSAVNYDFQFSKYLFKVSCNYNAVLNTYNYTFRKSGSSDYGYIVYSMEKGFELISWKEGNKVTEIHLISTNKQEVLNALKKTGGK
jgi:hypothetical protein